MIEIPILRRKPLLPSSLTLRRKIYNLLFTIYKWLFELAGGHWEAPFIIDYLLLTIGFFHNALKKDSLYNWANLREFVENSGVFRGAILAKSLQLKE